MGRTFDQWWNAIPKDIRNNLRHIAVSFHHKPINWKDLHVTLKEIKETNHFEFVPRPEEIVEWTYSITKNKGFDPTVLQAINPKVANVILSRREDITNLLKSVK